MPRIKLQTPNFNMTQRSDGYYILRYLENGVLKTKSMGTKDAKLAEDARARFVKEYYAPKISEQPTVREVCDAYLTYRKPSVKCPRSLEYSLGPIKDLMGGFFADTITQSVVADYAKKRVGSSTKTSENGGRWGGKTVSEATVSKELRILRGALRWAHGEGKLARRADFKVELSSGKARTDWLTRGEVEKLLSEAKPHIALFIRIAVMTAKRREAILSLTWDRVDLDRVGHESIDFGDDVGNKRRGITPIGKIPKLVEALKTAKAIAKTKHVIEYRGEPVKDVKTALTATCRRAGIRPVGAHIFKHTGITWMVQAGTSYERIAAYTHTSAKMIEQVYGKHSPDFLEEVSAAIAI